MKRSISFITVYIKKKNITLNCKTPTVQNQQYYNRYLYYFPVAYPRKFGGLLNKNNIFIDTSFLDNIKKKNSVYATTR